MNLGLTRSLQYNIEKDDSDCYTKALRSSQKLHDIFLSENYAQNQFNAADALDNISKFQVVFMDQYFACDFDLLLSKLLVRLEPL